MLNYSCINTDKTINRKHIPSKQFDQIVDIVSRKFKIKENLIFDVSFVNKVDIKKINNKYRKVNKPTDVISFALRDAKQTIESPLLGEIFICYEVASKQAKENKWNINKEICFLFIHGILHLLQYDHNTKKEYDEMMKIQNNILKEIRF